MTKKQFNFRIEDKLLELIQKQAESEGVTVTEWLTNAALTELGINERDGELRYFDEDRLEKIEEDIKSCQKGIQEAFNKLNIRIDELWDSVDYLTDDFEKYRNSQREYIKDSVRRYILAMQYRMEPRQLEQLESISEINSISEQAESDTEEDVKGNPLDKK